MHLNNNTNNNNSSRISSSSHNKCILVDKLVVQSEYPWHDLELLYNGFVVFVG